MTETITPLMVKTAAYILKRARVLSARGRKQVKEENFAMPASAAKSGKGQKGSYPIHDIAHARSALSYGAKNLSADEYAKLKTRVYAKYPSLKKSASVKALWKVAAKGVNLPALRQRAMNTIIEKGLQEEYAEWVKSAPELLGKPLPMRFMDHWKQQKAPKVAAVQKEALSPRTVGRASQELIRRALSGTGHNLSTSATAQLMKRYKNIMNTGAFNKLWRRAQIGGPQAIGAQGLHRFSHPWHEAVDDAVKAIRVNSLL